MKKNMAAKLVAFFLSYKLVLTKNFYVKHC